MNDIFIDYRESDVIEKELQSAIKALRNASNLIWDKRIDHNGDNRDGFGSYAQQLDNAANTAKDILEKVKESL